MFSKKGWFVLLSILALAIAEFILIVNKNMGVGCLLVFFQNIALPVLVTPILIEYKTFSIYKAPQLEWMLSSAIVGFIPTLSICIASYLDYYIGGGRERLDATANIKIPNTGEMILTDVISGILIVLCLTMLSALSGLFSRYWFKGTSKHKV